jgi:hypothetical protein
MKKFPHIKVNPEAAFTVYTPCECSFLKSPPPLRGGGVVFFGRRVYTK